MRSTPYRQILSGFVLLAVAGSGSALTLGRAQGLAVLGRPLDLSIQVGLDAASDVADLCTEAEVLYGDTRIEPRRIEVRATPSGDQVNLRLRVATPVDEAFVSVALRVGCGQPLTRRYVLLSEQPGDVAEAAAVAAPAGPQAVAPGSASGASSGAGINPNIGSTLAAAATALPAEPARRVARPANPAPRPVARPAAPAGDRPRLKLDALEVRPPSQPAKAVVAAVPAAPALAASMPPAPASAPAAAASQPSVEVPQDGTRILSLEADLRALRESVMRSNSSVNELRTRLEQAERERYANGLVYVLAGLLAAASALAGLFWWRGRRGDLSTRDWWLDAPATDSIATPRQPVAPSTGRPVVSEAATAAAASTVAASPVAKPGAAQAMPSAAPAESMSSLLPLAGEGVRVSDPMPLSSDELSDIQQEADFFMSLGEYDRAIEVLRNHIEAHPQASAVAWLDLLEIHHKLGRREEYEQLRRDFEWLFNARLPGFDQFEQGQQGLESQPALLGRIQQLWPHREVLQVIDSAIFRRPAEQTAEPLGLEAYRDLLFLHHVASELCANESTDLARSFSSLPVEPVMVHAPSLASDGLDINLDNLQDLEPVASEPAPLAAGETDTAPATRAARASLPALDELPADSLRDDHRLLDFHVDEGDLYKLPNQKPPQA